MFTAHRPAETLAETIEDRIRTNLPQIRQWMLDVVAGTVARRLLDQRALVPDNYAQEISGPARLQTPGPGQT